MLVDWTANRVWDAWGLKEEKGRYGRRPPRRDPGGAVLQLGPALDPSRFDLTPQERAVAVAAQRYGMVNVDNAGGNVIYAQGLYPGMARSWEGKLRGWKAGTVGIPIHHYRVLKVGETRKGGLSSEELDRRYLKVRSR